MPPVFLKNREQLRASTPPPTSPLLPEIVSPTQTSGERTNPSRSSFEEYWWRRSPSPTLSVASSDSDQSLISALWDKIYKGRVLVGDSDGWRYEWHDEVDDKIPTSQSVNTNTFHAKNELQLEAKADEHSTTSESRGNEKKSSGRSDTINEDVFYEHPSASTPSATVEVRASPARIKRSPVQGGTLLSTSIRRKSPRLLQKGTSPQRPRLSTTSADRRRRLERERKARARARDSEAMKAKQAIYAANYRARNREMLQAKARDYRRKHKVA
ncbi:hypothetical protein VNI00_017850 [Paramarasmius palmivorus]|uniref:Uncharacterized protein n=1 Tax=Paramarasmius palmivorus TaxID=297713 RepID=A0AAW0B2F8_9AGAR